MPSAIKKTLDAATLANGTRLLAAGSGKPRRIEAEDDYVFDVTSGHTPVGICFGSDDASIIAASGGGTSVKKYTLAGATSWTVSGVTAASSLFRTSATKLAVARNAAVGNWWEIDESVPNATSKTQPTNSTRQIVVVPGTTDKAWGHTGGTTATEFVPSTGAATGRTQAIPSSNITMMWAALDESAVPCLYMLSSGGTLVYKYRESDLTLLTTWTNNGTSGLPGGGALTAFIVGADGKPLVNLFFHGDVDQLNLTGGNQRDVAARFIYAADDVRGPQTAASIFPLMALSSNGRYVAYLTTNAAGTASSGAIRVRNILRSSAATPAQYALWEHTFSSADVGTGTLDRLMLAGKFGSQYGVQTGWRAGTAQDFKRSVFYYQRDSGGGGTPDASRVEFTPGTRLGITIADGQKLSVWVDFQFVGPGGPPPYVEEDSEATGLLLLVDSADEEEEEPSAATSTTDFETMRDNMCTVLRALTPRRLSDRKFDQVTDEETLTALVERMPAEGLFRKFEILRAGERSLLSPTIINPTAVEYQQAARLLVCYPVLKNLVGVEKLRDLEDLMDADAQQLRDALFASDNYVSGQSACWVEIGEPDRSTQVYVQAFNLRLDYYEAMNLYAP